MGRIGRAVALRALAFRMRVVAFDTFVHAEFDERHGIERLPLDELLASSDVVSLHLPFTEATRGMVNREFLAKMRPGSYLVNTSRGGLVVETDLRDALVSGHLAGAGLDVLNHEPPEPGNPLLGLPNVVLSPHIAGTDTQSMRDMAELAATTIVELHRIAGRRTASSIPNCATDGSGDHLQVYLAPRPNRSVRVFQPVMRADTGKMPVSRSKGAAYRFSSPGRKSMPAGRERRSATVSSDFTLYELKPGTSCRSRSS